MISEQIRPRFDVISLFPEIFAAITGAGITGRAFTKGLGELHLWNPRDYALDAYKSVDDRSYGGGPGMVMMAEPLAAAIADIRKQRADKPPVVYLTPHGYPLKQATMREFQSSSSGAIVICGRYEGVDQRLIDQYVTHTFCIGDFVVSGGELPTMMFIDAWVRLLPGAMNDALSTVKESFEGGLLDYPHYTRPEIFENIPVPPVLLSGHHAKIEGWRCDEALKFTAKFRPDLLK
jgi:tRNA (guanine37-N1)-methyltransferase